jgi:hypothetical protein
MPLYEIQGPDGKLYEIEGPAGASKEQIVAAIQAKLAETPAQKEGLGAAVVGGAKRLGSALQTGVESLFDAEGAAKRGAERQALIGQQYAPGADLEKVKQAYAERGLLPAAGEVISQIPGAFAEQAPNLAAIYAGGKTGALAGAKFGPKGALIGGVGGAAAPIFGQLFGSGLERQAEEGADISRGRAAAAAVPGTALEFASLYIPLGRNVVGKLLGPEVEKALARGTNESIERLAKESLGKTLAKGAGVGVLAEIPTEITQQILERWQAGLSLTTPDALAEYGEAAYGAGLVGAPFGAIGRTGQRSVARGREEERVAEERGLQEQLAEQERLAAEEAEVARKASPEYRQELNNQFWTLKDELAQVEPIAKDKTQDEDVRNEAIARAKEIKKELQRIQAEMKASMKEAGAAPTLEKEKAKGAREMPVVDEFGNVVKIPPKKAPLTEEEYGERMDAAASQWQDTQKRIQALREQEDAEKEAQREQTYAETQQGIQNYLAQLDQVDETNTKELVKRLAAEQQRREQDVAQEIAFDRIQLVLDNFGLRAAGISPDVRKAVESKIDEGVIDRTVTKALGIEGLEGRTFRGEDAQQALSNVQNAINKLEDRRQRATESKQQLIEDNGQLTPAGYKLVALEARLNELKRLAGVITSRTLPETGAESSVQGLLGAVSKMGQEPVAVQIEPGKPSGYYKQKAEEARKTAGGNFTDIVALMDDYRQGRFFGEAAAPEQRKLASSTPEGLLAEAETTRKEVVDSVVQEVAYERQAQGLRALTRDEAIGLAIRVDEALKEIITRGAALPRGAAIRDVVLEPAQVRGTEIIKSAKIARMDPRPLAERQFGSPRRAVEVLAEYIKQTRDDAVQSGKRSVSADRPLLKKQYAPAPTDLVKDLDQVIRMENLQPAVRDTLEQVQRRFEEGDISAELEELVEEQVGRILRGTDRPFMLERDVTQPGGRRAMAAAGTAELIGDIQNQLRTESDLAQFAATDAQTDLFSESVATARATPAQFQRLQKSGKVQKERDAIAAKKAEAQKAQEEQQRKAREKAKLKAETAPAKQVEDQMQSVRNVLAEVMDEYSGKKQAEIREKNKQLSFLMKSVRTRALKQVNDISNKRTQARLAKDMESELALFFPKEAALIEKLQKEVKDLQEKQVTRFAILDKRVQAEVKFLKELEKRAALAAKGTPEQRKAQKQAAIVRGQVIKAEQTLKDAKRAAADRESQQKALRQTGLDLPGIRVTAERRELAKGKGVVRRSKIAPIKTRAEVEALKAERGQQRFDENKPLAKDELTAALAKIERLSSGQRTTQTKLYMEAVTDAKRAQADLDKYIQNLRGKEPNKQRIVALRNEVDEANKVVRELNRRIVGEISASMRGVEEAAIPVRKAAARSATSGEIPFYDKKFTPDQMRSMSRMGLSAFDGGRSYSVDDTIDFRLGDTEGGGIDLVQAADRMAELEKKAQAAGIKMKYFPTMKDLTMDILRSMTAQGMDVYSNRIRGGVQPDGTVFVVGENHDSMVDLEKTIAHEFVGHYTVEGVLGEKGMVDLMKKVDKTFATKDNENGLEVLAKELGVLQEYLDTLASTGKFYDGSLNDGTKTEREVRELAKTNGLREIIAYTMEKRVDESFMQKAGRWLKELVGAMRNALRKMGLDLDLSTSDLFYLMKQAQKSFEDGKPIAYKKPDGTVDFRATTPKYNAGLEDLGAIADKMVGRQKSVIDKVKANVTGLAARVQFVDRFAALEALANRGVSKGIIDSLKAQDMMYFARMSDQRHSFVAEIANNGTLKLKDVKRPDGSFEKLIESDRGANLKDISQALLGAGVGDADATGRLFTMYLAAERAMKLKDGINKLNFSGKITKADLDKALAFGRSNAAFQKAREMYNQYNKGLIDFAVQSGALSKERGDALTKQGDYIPYYRMRNGVVDLFIGSESPIRIGDIKNQPYLEELVGGDEAIMDFFTSSLQNTSLLTDMALRNLATRNAAFVLNDMGIAELHNGDGPASTDVIRFSMDEVDKSGKVVHRKKWARIDTKLKEEVFGDIPSDLVAKGMEGIKIVVPGAVRILGTPANWLRKFVTRDPRYAVRQIFRDSMAAALTTGGNIMPVASTMKEISKMYSKGGSDAFRKLQQRGVLGGQVITGAPEDMAKIMQQITAGKPGWDMAMAKLDSWAQAGDAGTRMALYNSFLRQGLSEREATLGALESMNFGRRGVSPSIYFLNATIPFFNAGVQGIDVLYRAFTGQMPYEQKLNVQKKLLMRGGMMAMMTMAYAAMMEDDEAYKNAPAEQRYGNWFVRIPGIAEPFRVPIPFEVGLLFKAVPEGIYNALFTEEKGSKVAKDLALQLGRSLPGNPAEVGVPVPTAIKPFIETALNKSFFTGREIVDARLDQLDKEFQYREKTPEVLKTLGPVFAAVGLAPVQMENFIRSYTGSMGVGILSLANPVFKAESEVGEVAGRVSEMPLVGGLFQPNDAGRVINEAYDTVSEVQRKQQTYKKLIADGRVKDAEKYIKDNIGDIGFASYAGSFRQKMGELTKTERTIRALPATAMSPEEKRKRLDEVRQIKITMAAQLKSVREQTERQAAR